MNPTVTNSVATVPANHKILKVSDWELKRELKLELKLKLKAHVMRARVVTPKIKNIAEDDKYKLKAKATRTLKGYDYKMKNALEDPACKPLKKKIEEAIVYLAKSLKSIQNGGADVSYIKNTLLKQYTEKYYDPLFKEINQHKQRSARINENKQQK